MSDYLYTALTNQHTPRTLELQLLQDPDVNRVRSILLNNAPDLAYTWMTGLLRTRAQFQSQVPELSQHQGAVTLPQPVIIGAQLVGDGQSLPYLPTKLPGGNVAVSYLSQETVTITTEGQTWTRNVTAGNRLLRIDWPEELQIQGMLLLDTDYGVATLITIQSAPEFKCATILARLMDEVTTQHLLEKYDLMYGFKFATTSFEKLAYIVLTLYLEFKQLNP